MATQTQLVFRKSNYCLFVSNVISRYFMPDATENDISIYFFTH